MKKIDHEKRKQFGEQIQAWRKAAGLTQAQLADRVGQRYYTFISQVEIGKVRIPPQDLPRWAKALSISSADLALKHMEFNEPELFNILYPFGLKS